MKVSCLNVLLLFLLHHISTYIITLSLGTRIFHFRKVFPCKFRSLAVFYFINFGPEQVVGRVIFRQGQVPIRRDIVERIITSIIDHHSSVTGAAATADDTIMIYRARGTRSPLSPSRSSSCTLPSSSYRE